MTQFTTKVVINGKELIAAADFRSLQRRVFQLERIVRELQKEDDIKVIHERATGKFHVLPTQISSEEVVVEEVRKPAEVSPKYTNIVYKSGYKEISKRHEARLPIDFEKELVKLIEKYTDIKGNIVAIHSFPGKLVVLTKEHEFYK